MRIVVFLLLLTPVILFRTGHQQPAGGPPDVEVGEVSSSKFRTYESVDPSGRQRLNSNKADTRSRESVYREEIRNRNSIENRSRDMADLERSVMGEAYNQRPIDLFRYRVSLKNTGIKVVKAIVWDYQASDTDEFVDAVHRQFRCTSNMKPNHSERFEGFSPLPPTRVITASAAKSFSERVILNRIEYADGSSWQRADWRQPEVTSNYSSRGNCQQL
ncbi:MAG TPA: hypothetical protein VJ306_07500 [Pyrinomonadaceae bacterium]|jgi:hypothetical protein|nr:hypothetical protein [Pyrinomonadaceae bacterium]